MAYPPPPGTNSNSLPPRPPASAGSTRGGFKSSFSSKPSSGPQSYVSSAPSYSAPGYGQSAPPSQYESQSTYTGRGYTSSRVSGPPADQGYSQPSYGPSTYPSAAPAAPQIRNPFPTPGQGGAAASAAPDNYDPSVAAQIAQWQSAYVHNPHSATVPIDSPRPEAHRFAPEEKKKTVVREGGGKKWTDDSLLEWDPAHLRIFVGNLAGETTDESLLKAFMRWKSVQRAKVVRDKRTNKSKGYGFVSFSDADDFFQAAKEMNNKYIQSHPVVVRKANTEIKATNAKDKRAGQHKNKNKNRHHGGGNNSNDALGPTPGAGVTKPGQKTKNGLRLLG